MNFLNRLQPLGLLILRLALGTVMIAHGYQKVFGGMPQFMGMLSHMGIPAWMGYLTAAAEFGGGILLVVGFLTRLAALAIFIDMVVAIFKVHLHNGLFGKNGGFEFPMVCGAIAFSLIWSGAGPIAIDWLWGSKGRR
ncbi:MAG: DoxX family protein [Candidatus Korobacteraceae bacterium]